MPDLFDKIRGQIDAGITKVTTKSRVTVETTRLTGQIRRISKEKEDALLRLGAQVYKEMSDRGQLSLEGVQREIKRVKLGSGLDFLLFSLLVSNTTARTM